MAEAAGLALAVLPVLISVADYYRQSLESLQTLRAKVGDDRILEFYEEVAFEVFLLRNCIRKLVKDLPGFSLEYKRDLLRSLRPESWSDEKLSDALRAKLGETNYAMFELILWRLLASINTLISGNQQFLSSVEVVDESNSCVKLSMLRQHLIAGSALSTFHSRIRFTTSQHKRSKYLGKVTKYNERLQQLLEDALEGGTVEHDVRSKSPSPEVRAIAHALYDALSRTWACNCVVPHDEELFEARLCFSRESSFKNSFEHSFDILIATRPEKASSSCVDPGSWQESIIHAAPRGKVNLNIQNQKIESICEIVEKARGHDICLRMLLDDQKLWQVRPQGKRMDVVQDISLEDILHRYTGLRLRDKRILAVTLSKTVLQLSEGPWLRRRWTAAEITFCKTMQNDIDFERPYLSAQFNANSTDNEDPNFDAQSIHAIPSLLSLGKLLLEIDRGRPIETTHLDLTDGKFPNANTELTATLRIFKEASGDFYMDYTRAIKACLEPTFLRLDQTEGLEDDEVRQLVYEHVVAPLETELYNGFKLRL